jgi:hypothetical protein
MPYTVVAIDLEPGQEPCRSPGLGMGQVGSAISAFGRDGYFWVKIITPNGEELTPHQFAEHFREQGSDTSWS